MTKSMTRGAPAKLILFFALPLIAGNIFQQFYSMADTIIVGRTIGVNALAAVGCTGCLTFLVLGFVMGFTSGLSIITAQKFGAQDEEGVRRSFAVSIVLAAVIAAAMTVLAAALTRQVLLLLQTPTEILEDAVIYLRVIFLGIPATVLFNLTSNTMRALGDSRIPLYFLIFACIINIILDFVLILLFGMGVAGAALATIFSQLLSGVCCSTYIAKKMPVLRISREHFHLNKEDVLLHLRTAFPMAFQMSIIAIGSLILQSALNRLGAVSVAAYTAAQKIDGIATMPLDAFGAALTTFVAQNYGASRIDRVRKGVYQCLLMSVGVSLIMGSVSVLFGGDLSSLFVGTGETEVLTLARTFLTINGAAYWLLALLFTYRFTLQGLGRTFIPTVAGVMELLMRIVTALILTERFGFTGASFANPLAWIGALVPLAIAYYVDIRKMEKLSCA